MIGWVMHVPVLSTKHLTFGTMNAEIKDLQGPGGLFTVSFLGGFLVYVGGNGEDLEGDPEIPPDLIACLKWAREHGYDEWIRFDSHGTVVEELPRYE